MFPNTWNEKNVAPRIKEKRWYIVCHSEFSWVTSGKRGTHKEHHSNQAWTRVLYGSAIVATPIQKSIPVDLWMNLDPIQFGKKHPRSMQKMHHHRCHVILPGSLCDFKFFWAALFLKYVVILAVYSQFLLCNMSVNVSSYRRKSCFYFDEHDNSNFFERLEGWSVSLRPP